MVETSESSDEILKFNHSCENDWTVLVHGDVSNSVKVVLLFSLLMTPYLWRKIPTNFMSSAVSDVVCTWWLQLLSLRFCSSGKLNFQFKLDHSHLTFSILLILRDCVEHQESLGKQELKGQRLVLWFTLSSMQALLRIIKTTEYCNCCWFIQWVRWVKFSRTPALMANMVGA